MSGDDRDMFDDPFQQALFLAVWRDSDLSMDDAADLVGKWGGEDWWPR